MKRVTASEARRHWFRLLDEVAAGAVVLIERHGRRLVLRREPRGEGEEAPDYGRLIQVAEPERADRWGWTVGTEGELEFTEDPHS
ncbi:MAG: type II toxin-antitoxin system Phd/YefM family antitoxin [Longimicrobiales bacterium]